MAHFVTKVYTDSNYITSVQNIASKGIWSNKSTSIFKHLLLNTYTYKKLSKYPYFKNVSFPI